MRPPTRIQVPLSTGVTLDGAIWWPDVPDGVDVPLILWASPYEGGCQASVGVPDCDDAAIDAAGRGIGPARMVVPHGYAYALMNVRGTGFSTGCYTFYGPESRADLGALVDSMAEMEGINGRVAMWGLSAGGGTPFMAAVEAPSALKTIMPSGIITDIYLNRWSPQGAAPAARIITGALFPLGADAPAAGAIVYDPTEQDYYQEAVATTPERLCPETAENAAASPQGTYTDDRSPEYWNARNTARLLDNVEAAVFVQHGFLEGGHAFQDDAIWNLIDSPKRMLLGDWGHEFDVTPHLEAYGYRNSTEAMAVEWFDFWLKGIGEPPRTGIVDYQSPDKAWHEANAWPPYASSEVLYLADEGLHPQPGAATSFRAASDEDGDACGDEADASDAAGTRIVYVSAPMHEDILIAGNPMAYLELTSDQPGGIVAIDLHEVGPNGACDNEERFSIGGADLRHLDGTGTGGAFPTGQKTGVRIDLYGTARVIEAGNRIAAIISADGEFEYRGSPYQPFIAVGADSHIVLPLVEGTVNGEQPSIAYPPRPRIP